ncbi:peroxisomal acyl-coenzyme A oxidase 1-like [Mytilus galloprovincialis]|uniref:peroxisomal acyl-coenzyme A oxidase 1-like n=1 Tax=Mytilus galloprovincialis TaxID=29158 RepID=UPI003F7CA383
MSEQGVNTDLAKERLNATFDVENLTNLIYGGPEKVERRRQIHKVASEDPFYKTLKPWSYCSVEEQYENGLAKHNHIKESVDKLELNGFEDLYYYKSCVTPHEPGPLDVHYGMFIPTIEQQGTAEQKEKWLASAYSEEIKGTYAQTEMGHGTFLRGLETTATYDQKTKEFILNSPTLTSIKYWPAALGKTTNHCVVVAQLYTQGTCHGIHTFMLQTRSLEDHSVLPGIEVGVIGNKFGFGTNDNGYLKITNVRIPRDNMLMRYSKVLEDGTYIKPKNSKVSYGVMVYIRSMIVKQAFQALAEACVISIRYSAVRRQSETVPGGIEPQILDYQTQQYRLFPLLATSYALYFAGNYMSTAYSEGSQKIEKGQLEELPQLHALSAGLKAFTSYAASAGVEVCRICCGGHGYSHASGLPKIYVSVVPACTYEGENTVMMLQVARYLMKCYKDKQQGSKLPGFVSYIAEIPEKRSCMDEHLSFNCLVKAYKHRAARLIKEAAKQMQSLIQSGSPAHEAWNKSSVPLFWAANAHCHLFCVQNFVENVERSNGDSKTNEVLKAVCQLYSVHGILENLGEFIHDGFLSAQQVDYLQKAMFKLFEVIRPNAVALVDAFDIPDQVLQSCLGRYDGQVYQALYDYAKMAPMNQTEIHSTYYTHLRPLMNPETSNYSKL